MSAFKYMFVLLALALPAGRDPNPGARPLFKSGFEDACLEPVSGRAHNTWPRIRFPQPSLFNGSPFTLLQVVTADNRNPAPGSAADYIRNTIETVTGPYGLPTRALKMHILQPSPHTCCTQDTFEITQITAPVRDIYVAHWMRFNPEMLSQMQAQGASYWRMTFEMKTAHDYRIMANIQWSGVRPYYHAHGDNGGLSGPPTIVWNWEENNHTVPVPLDQWFYTEFYLHRAAGPAGRFFWGINGRTVIDHRGPTYGSAMEEISALMFSNLYGPNPRNWYQWLDDFEIWDLPPCMDLPCGPPQKNSY